MSEAIDEYLSTLRRANTSNNHIIFSKSGDVKKENTLNIISDKALEHQSNALNNDYICARKEYELSEVENVAYKCWLEVQEYIKMHGLCILEELTYDDFLNDFFL